MLSVMPRNERDDGHALVVRNGRARARKVTMGSGTVEVDAPRVNDKRVEDGERQRFTSGILPPYMRRSPKVSEVLPVLYLRGLSTNDFRPALKDLLRRRCVGTVANGNHETDSGMAIGIRRFSQARPEQRGLRLHLGRRHPLQCPTRR